MNIKRNLTILMVSLVLSVPVMSLKNEYQPADAQPQANFEIQLATVAEAEEQQKLIDEQKKAEELAAAQAAEAQRVAAQEAAQPTLYMTFFGWVEH